MAIDGDMDTMVAFAHGYIDEFFGGHADTDIVKIFDSTNPSAKKLMLSPGNQLTIRTLFCLIGDLIHKVWHLENP